MSPNKLLRGNKDRIILWESPYKENLDPKIRNKTQEWHIHTHTHTHTHRSGHAYVKYTADEEISPVLGSGGTDKQCASTSIEVDAKKQMFLVRCTAALKLRTATFYVTNSMQPRPS